MNTLIQTLDAEVGLDQMLAARDERAARQSADLERFGKPLVSVTVVMPGPVKDGLLPRRVSELALRQLQALATARHWPVLSRVVRWQKTGPEGAYIIDVEPEVLKAATVGMEDHHPLGRLWDLDVIAPGPRILSRKELGSPPRRCLVCDRPAFECGRSRRHPLGELLDTIKKIVHDYEWHSLA